MVPPPQPSLTEDWSHFDPAAYLDEYYGDIGSENLELLRFLAEAYDQIPKGGVLLDFGGGPTVYPLISAAPRVDEIHFSDYLDANLEEVRRWLASAPDAFDWNPFIRRALELESGSSCSDADVAKRARQIREKVRRLIRCDASRTPPLPGRKLVTDYDVVLTNFCAESATSDREQWRSYMTNIVSVLKPGGWLVMSALKGATEYSVGSESFPAVSILEDDLIELLEETGFGGKEIEVRSVGADRPTRDYQGLILALARKQPAGGRRR